MRRIPHLAPLLASLTLTLTPVALAATPAAAPLVGDVVHGAALLQGAGDVRVDGAWLNAYTDEEAVARLASGEGGFPRIDSDNVLDRWDALALIKARNTSLAELVMGGDHVLVTTVALDDNARMRLRDKAKVPAALAEGERRVFSVYKLEDKREDGAAFVLVREQDTRKRDLLKKNTKVGYVVFLRLPGFRGGEHEAAFAVDKDIRIRRVVIRAPDGSVPDDLAQAAARFVGKGVRGQYAPLKAGGAAKAVGELERPLSDAFLAGMEAVYMSEVAEREHFAFDN